MGPITERIDAARSRRGMFKRDLMQLIGVGEHRWERAKRNDSWTDQELSDMAVALKVSVEWLTSAGRGEEAA